MNHPARAPAGKQGLDVVAFLEHNACKRGQDRDSVLAPFALSICAFLERGITEGFNR
jgi:hypothetical protein